MSKEQPGQEARQWPVAPPAAERRAAEVEDDFSRGGAGPAPEPAGPAQATLLEPDHAEEFRRRWDAIKASFVDDPQAAVRRAEQLADEVAAEVARAVDARRRDLIERREGIDEQDEHAGTERLRLVLHGYHSVLDPVLGS
jgi:hypothetical protein